MKKYLLLLVCSVCVLASRAQDAKIPEGKTYSVKLKIEGEERRGMKWNHDELSFKDGKLISKEMGEHEKFPPFACRFTTAGNEVHFTAAGGNDALSHIEWEGTVSGSKIEGKATWTNANGPQVQSFSGKLK